MIGSGVVTNIVNEDEINHFIRRAKACAVRNNCPEIADDFASEIFVTFLSNPDRGATIEQLFYDFYRKEYGDSRSKAGLARQQATKFKTCLYNDEGELRGDIEKVASKDISESLDESISVMPYHICKPQHREIYDMYFESGMTMLLIAQELGVTESRISQILKPIKESITQAALLQTGRERMEWDDAYPDFSISWLTW